MTGKVYLVGAGPGDEGLITVKGAKLLRRAEAVVYDRLVGAGVLAQIPESAEKIDVGKRAGGHSAPQGEINAILLAKAAEGKRVVRLKGGDPFLFGRGGEELEALERNGVPYEVVPGVTSAIGGAAYAGIPVTHRDFSSAVHIFSGHAKGGAPACLDFEALARLSGTLVFMMSACSIKRIAEGLMSAGMDAAAPAAVIENAATPKQRVFIRNLADIARCAEENGVRPPALFIVGAVCSLGERFNWFGKLPLAGRRVLVTRPEQSAGPLCERLRELGADVTLYPCIVTKPLPFDADFAAYDWLIFTSAAGVNAALGPFFKEHDARGLCGKHIAAVGPQTREELLKYGIRADFTPAEHSAEGLARELLQNARFFNERLLPQIRVGLFRARDGAEDMAEILQNAGLGVTDVPVYETVYIEQKPLELKDYDCVTFTSASCVTGFCRANAGADFSGINAVCIGQKTALAARKAGMRATFADDTTIESMTEKITEMYKWI